MTKCYVWLYYSGGTATVTTLDLDLSEDVSQQIYTIFGGIEKFKIEVKR